MVYCGKPSKGCANCRLRRIKCDLKDPSCSQCMRAGKQCAGYRDQLTLMFRDENAKVARRARESGQLERDKLSIRKSNRTEIPHSSREIEPSNSKGYSSSGPLAIASDFELQAEYQTALPLRLEFFTLEERGLSFFFTHYISAITPFSVGAPGAEISSFWSRGDESFFNAASSVGLAGLSNVTNDRSLMLTAHRKHMAALNHVAGVLNNIDNTKLGETVKEVMLLAIFEMVDCEEAPNRKPGVHIEGAVALLRMGNGTQGPKQPGIRMQLQLCILVFVKYFETGGSIPAEIAETIRHCGELQTAEDLPAANLISNITQFIELRARIKRSERSDPASIVESALLCEKGLEQWELDLPDEWKPVVVSPAEHKPSLYRREYLAYRDIWTARMWSYYRWARILVNELLLAHLDKLLRHTREQQMQRARCLKTISSMASDVCTSVPSQFAATPLPHRLLQVREDRSLGMTGVFLMMFPLAVAGGASGVPDELHYWAMEVLGQIGRTMGVKQALALMRMTKMRRDATKMGAPGLW